MGGIFWCLYINIVIILYIPRVPNVYLPTCVPRNRYIHTFINIYIYIYLPTYANFYKVYISQGYPTFPFKEWPTLWPQHRQQQKNPRKKISRWHGRTGQQETGSGQGGCILIACSIFWKNTHSVYLLVWICDIFWSDSCVFVGWKSSHSIYIMLVGSWGTALRSIDKHEKAWMSPSPRYAAFACDDAFGSQKLFFFSRNRTPKWPQPIWRLITHS